MRLSTTLAASLLLLFLIPAAGSVLGAPSGWVLLENVTGEYGPDTVDACDISFDFRFTVSSSDDDISAFCAGFRIYSPDGARWWPRGLDTASLGWQDMFDNSFAIHEFGVDGHGADTFGICASSMFGPGMAAGFDERVFSINIRTFIDASADTICIDSAFFPPSGVWAWESLGGGTATPVWDGPRCVRIVADYQPGNVDGSPYPPYVDNSDLVYLVDHILAGGPAPMHSCSADIDSCLGFTTADVYYLVAHMYQGGPAPYGGYKPACDSVVGGVVSMTVAEGLLAPDTIAIGTPIVFDVRFENNTSETVMSYSNGLKVYSPSGANWSAVSVNTTQDIHDVMAYPGQFIRGGTGDGVDSVSLYSIDPGGSGMSPGFDAIAYTVEIGPFDSAQAGRTLCIDSCWIPPVYAWRWDPGLTPSWGGPYCYVIDTGHNTLCGDANDDGHVDVMDLVAMVNYLFNGVPMAWPEAADVDPFPGFNISDVTYLANYLYKAGPEPCAHLRSSGATPGGRVTLTQADGLYSASGQVKAGVPITFYLGLANDADGGTLDIPGLTSGFRVYSASGAKLTSTRAGFVDTFYTTNDFDAAHHLDGGFYLSHYSGGSGVDTIGFGGYASYGNGLPAGLNVTAYAITMDPISPTHVGDTLCIDSCWYPPAGEWVWSTGTEEYAPLWEGPYCFEIVAVPSVRPAFHADVVAGPTPLTVQFTPDCPDVSGTEYHWEFGDLTSYDGRTPPPHVYTSEGMYDVSLKVTDAIGSDSLTRFSYIRASDAGYVDLFAGMSLCHYGGISSNPIWYRCSFNNVGTAAAENCTLFVRLPDQMTLDSLLDSTWAPVSIGYTYEDDSLIIPLGTVQPGNDWLAYMPYGSSSAAGGDTLRASVRITTSSSEAETVNNSVTHKQAVVDPYSFRAGPTRKMASPDGVSLTCAVDPAVTTQLSYVVSFENQSQDVINYLYLVDTLDTDFYAVEGLMDLESRSHPIECDRLQLIELGPGAHALVTDCSGLDLQPGEIVWFEYGLTHRVDPGESAQITNTGWMTPQFGQALAAPAGGELMRMVGDCCLPPIRGDINYDDSTLIDIADLVYLTDYMFTNGIEPPCFEEADVNASGGTIIDIDDLIYLVEYMFEYGNDPFPCP